MGKRRPQSRRRGRPATPAEVVLRLLILKHLRNWSFAVLEREVRANALYRHFTRIGWEAVPGAKTLARIAPALGPEVVAELHQRLVEMAREERIVSGRRLRVDTTVVETNVHYPTDSGLLAGGLRVLTRTMRQLEQVAGAALLGGDPRRRQAFGHAAGAGRARRDARPCGARRMRRTSC